MSAPDYARQAAKALEDAFTSGRLDWDAAKPDAVVGAASLIRQHAAVPMLLELRARIATKRAEQVINAELARLRSMDEGE